MFENVIVTNKGVENIISMIVINKNFLYSITLFKWMVMRNKAKKKYKCIKLNKYGS